MAVRIVNRCTRYREETARYECYSVVVCGRCVIRSINYWRGLWDTHSDGCNSRVNTSGLCSTLYIFGII